MPKQFHDSGGESPLQIGTVALSGTGGVNISAQVDVAGTAFVAPYGVYSKPPEQERAAMMADQNGQYYLLGCIASNQPIQSGEILIKAGSGAYLYLKSNGEIELNGLVINQNGQIQSK